jgi:surface protein with Ig-like domain/HYR domain-containing protein
MFSRMKTSSILRHISHVKPLKMVLSSVSLLIALSAPARAQQSCPATSVRPPSTSGAEPTAKSVVAPVNSLVLITALESGGALNSFVGIDNTPAKNFYATWSAPPAGTQFNAGLLRAGDELVLRISTDFFTFRTGPASRNPDNLVHANIYQVPGTQTIVLIWEDGIWGGDHDYDDVTFQVCFLTDTDLDGIPDEDEKAGPFNGDANGDGTQDYLQSFVSSNKQVVTILEGWAGGITPPPTQQASEYTIVVAADPTTVEQLRSTTSPNNLLSAILASGGSTSTDLSVVRSESELSQSEQQALLQHQQQFQEAANADKTQHDIMTVLLNQILAKTIPSRPRFGLPRNKRLFANHASRVRRGGERLNATEDAQGIVIARTIPPGIQPNTYFNFGPTPDNRVPHAYEFLFDGTTGAEFLPGGVLLHYVDGQRGDNDLTVNGVIVLDGAVVEQGNSAPTAQVHEVTKAADANCQANITAEDVDAGSSDPDGGDSITLSLDNYGPFSVGTHQVTLTVTDSHGASNSAVANVIVTDGTAPLISLNGLQTISVELGSAFTDPGATANDNCAGNLTAQIVRTGAVDTGAVGSYLLNYSVTDGFNPANRSRTVNVVDTTAPALSCPAAIIIDATSAAGANVNYLLPVATDLSPVFVVCSPATGNMVGMGTTNAICTATDTSSNAGSCNFSVTVLAPRAIEQDVLSQLIQLRAGVTDKQDGDRLDDAIKHLTKSLDADLWLNDSRPSAKDGEKVFSEVKDTVNKLRDLIKDKHSTISDAALQRFIERLLGADRVLVLVATTNVVDPRKLAKAINELEQGDRDAAGGKYDSAIEHYRQAWSQAVKA